MMELATAVIMMLIAVLGGSAAVVVLGKHGQLENWRQAVFSWVFCCYFEFGLLNCLRVILLRGNVICTYRQDMFLLFFDVIFTIAGVPVVCYLHRSPVRLMPAGIFCYYTVLFCVLYGQYQNVNAVIYALLIPNRSFYAWAVLFLCYLSGNGIFPVSGREHWKGMKEYTQWAVIVLFIVTFLISPVVETYIMNAEEFSFGAGSVWYWFLLHVISVLLIMALFCVLLHGRLKAIFLFSFWGLSICAYVQGMFLNGRLFLMDGKQLDWSVGLKVINIAVWCAILLALAAVCRFSKGRGKKIILFSSIVLSLMQITGSVSLLPRYFQSAKKEELGVSGNNYFSTKGLHEAAGEENIIIFVLDTYDVDYMNEVLGKYPDFLTPLKGFTYFPDTVSQFSRTFPSIPYMLTESQYFYEIPLDEYVNLAFDTCDFWRNLKDKGIPYYIYEADENVIGNSVKQEAGNYVREGHILHENTSFAGCIEAVSRISAYRLFPYVFKEYYNYTSGTINELVVTERIWDLPAFVDDDIAVYDELRNHGLHVSEKEDKALRFIHLNGAHAPYTMDENGAKVRHGEGTALWQYVGCMNLVYDYLRMLQELGIYENSTIIITADHGESYVTEQLEQNTNPILFIKPFGVKAEEEMKVSEVYASQNDLLPTIAALHEIDYEIQGGGKSICSTGKRCGKNPVSLLCSS